MCSCTSGGSAHIRGQQVLKPSSFFRGAASLVGAYLLTHRPRGFWMPSERSGPLKGGPCPQLTAGTGSRKVRQPPSEASLRRRRLSKCRSRQPVQAGGLGNGIIFLWGGCPDHATYHERHKRRGWCSVFRDERSASKGTSYVRAHRKGLARKRNARKR